MTEALLHFLIVVVASGGFFIAYYIRRQKVHQERLVCPLDSNCEAVVTSQYSTIVGVPLEIIGMVYYALVVLGHATLLVIPSLSRDIYSHLLLAATAGAFIFSLYLTFIQAVKLREWCTWCLTSALFCTIIFVSVLALS